MMEAPEPSQSAKFVKLIQNPLKLRLFLLRSLPSAFFAGVRIVSVNEDACTVSVPYKYFNKNPFRSTYFACLSMAAELSTGVLVMSRVWGQKFRMSMLVTSCEANFYKKAVGLSLFTCSDGDKIKAAVQNAYTSGGPEKVKVMAEGRNTSGEKIADFWFEWSFKVKAEK